MKHSDEMSSFTAQTLLDIAFKKRVDRVNAIAEMLEQLVLEARPSEELGRHYIAVANLLAKRGQFNEAFAMREVAKFFMQLCPTGTIELQNAAGLIHWQQRNALLALRAFLKAAQHIRQVQETNQPVKQDLIDSNERGKDIALGELTSTPEPLISILRGLRRL